jgi:cobalt-zinc-cadmium resistance protein CzcA
VAIEQVSGLPQLLIKPDRSALARYGMTINELNTIVAVAVGGETAGEIYEGEKRFDIVVRMADQARSNVEAIRNLPVATPAGPRIPLGSLAAVTLEEGPVQISREEGSRFTTVQANVRGRDVESFVEEIQPIIAEQVQLPPGYSLTYGGQFENLRSASSRLALIVPVALLLIFILLYQTFASMRLALMIFVCIPLALIGGVAALFIAGLPFSISAGVGFIALFGIAVLNGIVMVAAIRKHHTGGMSRREAVLHGADERLRPVITTAALAGFGFLPMLLAHSAGAEVQRPLATVVIGGLISCTLLTLFLLPILYDWFGTIDDNNTNGTHDLSGPTPSPAPPTHLPVIALLVLAGLLYGTTAMAQEPLTLQKVVERTLASSPELRQSDALITQRKGEHEAAWAIPATEVFYGNEESPALFTSNLGIRSYGIAQSIEFPLVYTTQSRSTELLVQAAQTSRADVERSLRRRAALAYNEAITTRALLAMADSMIAVTRRFYEASARRREAGEATALETLQASVAVANAERQRQQAEGSFNAALAVLRTLMAEPPDAPLIITEAPGLQAIGLSAEELEQRIAVHPRLQTGSLTVEAAHAQQQTEVYRNYPGLSLEYAEQTMNDVAGFQSGKIGLTLPLGRWLSGGANKQARAGVMIAEAELESTRRSMLTTARELYIRYTTAREGVSMYQQQILPQAQEAYRIAVRLYEEGDTGYLDVLNAQTQLISTTMIVLQELQAAGQMAIELDYLLGR